MRVFRMAVCVLAISGPLAGEELWRGTAGSGECRLRLVNEVPKAQM